MIGAVSSTASAPDSEADELRLAEIASVIDRLGPIADRLGSRAAVAQYEADIGDPARTRAGTSFAGQTKPLPRFLPMRDIVRISFNIHDLAPGDTVPRRLARSTRLPADDNLTNCLPYAPTLEAALGLSARYANATLPWFRWQLEPIGNELCIVCHLVAPLGRIEALSTELALTSVHRIVELFVGIEIADARMSFALPPVSDPADLAGRLGCAVVVGGDVNALIIPRSWSARLSPYHDAGSWQEGRARCEADIRLLQDPPLVCRVRAHVRRTLEAQRVPMLAETAEMLRIPVRTLVRALTSDGTTHHRIVDTERRGLAQALLAQPTVPLADIVDALGFSDPSCFGRKCRAWFNDSPARVRIKMMQGLAA